MEKPLICRMNGAAAGLGATIALLCDVIVADEAEMIGDPHMKAGLVAGDGGAVIWPALIGMARAKEMLLTGAMITAVQAERIGLVNHAVAAEELDRKVAEVAEKLLASPRGAVRWTKSVMIQALKQLAIQSLDASAGWCVMIAATTALTAAYLPRAQLVFGDPGVITGGVFAPLGKAVAEGDHWQVTGR